CYPHFSFLTLCAHPHLHSFPTRRSSDLLVNRHQAVFVLDREHIVVPDHLQGRDEVGPEVPAMAVADGAKKERPVPLVAVGLGIEDRKSTRLNSSHVAISYAVFCLKKKTT